MENAASRFGQRLAHTEKKYRDQALKKLTLYVSKRTEWSDLEWDKLWKALFYCMWMSDKRPIQEELSSNLAGLVHKIPTPESALGFVHSFFRTMHREWHGIDGLRLDKFYSLIRKVVNESLELLQQHNWDTELAERWVSIISTEVMSQLPNGLRLHISDIYLVELHKAAGATVDTESFLLLLEPFFTLLSSEYDKTVFKRVRELVFLPLLTTYKFGPQPEKPAKSENDETDDEEEDDDQVFEHVDLAAVQHRIFSIASADDTAERNRSVLYDLYSQFFQVTKIDSLKVSKENEGKPVRTVKKRKQPDSDTTGVVTTEASESSSGEKKKKNKKRKKSKHNNEEAGESKPVEEPIAEVEKDTPTKKAKAAPAHASEKPQVTSDATPTKAKKKGDSLTEAAMTRKKSPIKSADAVTTEKPKKKTSNNEDKPVDATSVEASDKKSKKDSKLCLAPSDSVSEGSTTKKAKVNVDTTKSELKAVDKKKALKEVKKPDNLIVRSGMKFRRCMGCGGYGKGLVPVGKDACRHCERTGQLKKKAAAADKKKRKASEIAAAASAATADAPSKKVTFGKNKSLPHELSVKRLKASAKKEPVVKEDGIKGVLKATEAKKKAGAGGRKKASDFF